VWRSGADFDVDDAESSMNDVAANGELDVEYIAGKLSAYADPSH
jgi:death-on-curing protein